MTHSTNITDLRAVDLSTKLGLSRSYAFELLNKGKRPSLEVAVKIEREFGVPADAWITRDEQQAA